MNIQLIRACNFRMTSLSRGIVILKLVMDMTVIHNQIVFRYKFYGFVDV